MDLPQSDGAESSDRSPPSVDQDQTSFESHEEPTADTYAFRLFATPRQPVTSTTQTNHSSASGKPLLEPPPSESFQDSSSHIQQIRLATPPPTSPGQDNGPSRTSHARAQNRPLSYYLAATPTASQRSEYAAASQSGELVRQLAKRPCPGLRLPWRVILIPPSSIPSGADTPRTSAAASVAPADARTLKRTRAGKKSRLKIRRKMQALEAKKEARIAGEREKAQVEKAKEEKIKERNKRRNREKQLKRRERERERRKSQAEHGEEQNVMAAAADAASGDNASSND